MSKWWRVEVSDDAGQIVAIEPEMLAGREITDAESKVIENAAFNLLGFIGYGVGTVEYQAGALAMREAAANEAHEVAKSRQLACKRAAAAGRENVSSHRASDCETASAIELRIRSIDPATLKGK